MLAACSSAAAPRPEPLRPAPVAAAPPGATAARISAVVRSQANQASLERCYARTLTRTGRVASGRVDVTVSIGSSGAVERVAVKAPSRLDAVESCLKLAISHWVFPTNREAYATSFPLVLRSR